MDKYDSMTALYADPNNIEGSSYGKRWKRHEWSQMLEAQASDNAETSAIVMALHGGGIEPGTSEIALAVAGYHPGTLIPADDGQGVHDLWLFEGLLPKANDDLHVTASNYNEPIAEELVRNAQRCISLHGCSDRQAKVSHNHPVGILQIGGRDFALRQLALERLLAADILAEITTNDALKGEEPDNIANKTQTGGCVQLEMGTTYRASLFDINTRPQRKNTTNATFWRLVTVLRQVLSESRAETSC